MFVRLLYLYFIFILDFFLHSRVHSPIDLSDLSKSEERFPTSKDISFMDCTVHSGEAIFVPSFFWHEVTSAPSKPVDFNSVIESECEGDSQQCAKRKSEISFNLAVNHWFAPLYNKEFPCATCRKELNAEYRPQLEKLFELGFLKN